MGAEGRVPSENIRAILNNRNRSVNIRHALRDRSFGEMREILRGQLVSECHSEGQVARNNGDHPKGHKVRENEGHAEGQVVRDNGDHPKGHAIREMRTMLRDR